MLVGISFPVMAGKQIINVIQLVKASRWLAEGDIRSRRAAGLPRKRSQRSKKTQRKQK
jgi:CDP-diacylglycerol--inositol 3-phosphatidyltransferase